MSSHPELPYRPHVLYRMYDRNEDLLYIGMTGALGERLSGHRGSKQWWGEVATIRVEHFASRAEVDRTEAVAIQTEAPRHGW